MTVKDADLRGIGPWPKGVNNLAPEYKVPEDSLRAALNVDINDEGWPLRRNGFSRVINATMAHSLGANSFPYALYVDNGSLKAFDANLNVTTLASGFANDQPLCYATVNGSMYYSNGVVNGRVDTNLNVRTFGVETPAGQPLLTANTTVGGLDAGTYQVAVSYMDDTGTEGGTGLAASVVIATGGGIQLSDIPQPASTHVQFIRVWVSKANGDVLYWHRDLPSGTTSYLLGVSQLGKQLETQFLQPMPAAVAMCVFNARLYVAVGKVLYFSELYRFGIHNPTRYMAFPDPIVMVRPSRGADIGGIYVGTNDGKDPQGGTIYFLRGADAIGSDGVQGFVRTSSYSAGVIPGSDTTVTGTELGIQGNLVDDDVPVWLATTGVFCVGLTDGNIEQVSNDRLRLPQFARGAAIYREREGTRQVLFNLRGSGPASNVAASDSVVATVYRNGVAVD